MSISMRLVALPIATLLMATASMADGKPNYSRPGWYLGVGGGGAFDFFDDYIAEKTLGLVNITSGGSFNARGGYRLTSWFAAEVMYEGIYGTGIEVAGLEVAQLSTHSLLGNLKFILPVWRLHPYFIIGLGIQQGNFDAIGVLDPLDTRRWDFVVRLPVGLDAYITENWLVNVELAPSVRFADYKNLPSELTDNVSLTVTGGIQYRF